MLTLTWIINWGLDRVEAELSDSDPLYNFINYVESETESSIKGDIRKNFHEHYLVSADKNEKEFLDEMREEIMDFAIKLKKFIETN